MGEDYSLEAKVGHSMSCDCFVDQVKRDFDYLFSQCGFKVVHVKEFQAHGNFCSITLKSSKCYIKIYRKNEEFNLMLCSVDAIKDCLDVSARNVSWFYVRDVLNYVNRIKPDVSQLVAEVKSRSIDEQSRDLAKRLEVVCFVVMNLFQKRDLLEDFIHWREIWGQEIRTSLQSKYSITRNNVN